MAQVRPRLPSKRNPHTDLPQKATKQLATRNASSLRLLHTLSLSIHSLFLLLRLLIFRTLTLRSFALYLTLSAPALLIEFWLERNSRPTYNASGDLVRAGDDLDAKGMTEYLFDVMYWTWGNVVLVALFGNKAWWLWGAVPLYSAWAAWKAVGGVKSAMGGLAGAGNEGGEAQGQSKRQAKMEKKGGQRVQYRA